MRSDIDETHRRLARAQRGWTVIAICASLFLIAVYVLAVRTTTGQAVENAALNGAEQVGERAFLAASTALSTITYSSLALATVLVGAVGLMRRQVHLAVAAMAVILGQTYHDVFAAVGAHSGLPFGSAKDVPSAFAAMAGKAGDTMRTSDPHPTPTIIFQGSADQTVHRANADRIAADVITAGPKQTLLDRVSGQTNGRGFVRETTTTSDGAALLEQWTIEGLGHAWSGGKPGGSYSDPKGPDASAEMVRFFLNLRKG